MKKKILLLIVVSFISITVSAQAPFTIWEPAYTPRSRSVPSIPYYSLPDPVEEAERYNATIARARQIVSNETVSTTAFEYYSEKMFPMKVRIIQRRNGAVEISCIGIKKNNIWKPYDNEIVSLEAMYRQATTEKDKSTILELMEYGNYMLIINVDNEVYLIE